MIRNRKLKTFLVDTASPVLSACSRMIPKKENQIFIYNANDTLRDNSEALFDYLLRNGYNRDYRILTNIPAEERKNMPRVRNVFYTSKQTAVMDFMRSRYVFYSFGKLPITPTADQCVINLWHGIPLKTIANLSDVGNGKEFFFSYVCASSELYRSIMARAFGCPEENVCITGEPKTDPMYHAERLESDPKLIVWAPTFRQSSYFGYDDSSDSELLPLVPEKKWHELNAFLKGQNVRILVKLHGGQNLHGFTEKKYSNLSIFSDAVFRKNRMNLYAILGRADALLSDYSSVYLEYLALNRPIGFVIEDMREYEAKRGFVFENPLEYMPGEKIRTLEQLKDFIRDVASGRDPYAAERTRINDLVNQYRDGRNCERVLKIAGISKRNTKERNGGT